MLIPQVSFLHHSYYAIDTVIPYVFFLPATIEDLYVSVINCDYLPSPAKVEFPPELALMIVRKAAAMATAFEEKALDQMTADARRALARGVEPRQIVTQMGLATA